ncbi:HlyD family type I secretion periplasmic adaptor subunit [Acuticoccus sp.]|uniref:HlyD family type I secretion periplasmic adaptor subunit n=1 Tax=Acuticoccus sp. TaxID=1904378 RepID=UPI003B51FF93
MAQPSLPPPEPRRFSASIRTYVMAGTIACCALVFGFGGWAATAKLSSAVIASGTVVVASNVKQVQHPDGGIVGEIMVEDGQAVSAGDLLLRLDETLVAANRALLDGQIVALEARLARLQAERDDADAIAPPPELQDRLDDPLVMRALGSERKVFEARKATIAGQVDRLKERTKQLEQQIEGLTAQRLAKEEEIALIDEELEVLTGLFDRGRTTRDKIVNLRRNRTRLEGERGELSSQIAMARGRINETELEVLQLTTDRLEKTFAEVTEIEPELANLKERRAAADFQLKRMDIRSPADGTVFELAVHTVGGVVQPAETIMQVVPMADQLVIEARIAPTDVDQVAIGQQASVVLSAFDQKTAPQLHGNVTFVSAEASRDERAGLTYYVVRVALDESEIDRLPEGLALLPGMPAEVYISTGGQTVVAYLVRPLTEQIRRAWRET